MNVFKTMDGVSGPLWKQSIKQEQTCTYAHICTLCAYTLWKDTQNANDSDGGGI